MSKDNPNETKENKNKRTNPRGQYIPSPLIHPPSNPSMHVQMLGSFTTSRAGLGHEEVLHWKEHHWVSIPLGWMIMTAI